MSAEPLPVCLDSATLAALQKPVTIQLAAGELFSVIVAVQEALRAPQLPRSIRYNANEWALAATHALTAFVPELGPLLQCGFEPGHGFGELGTSALNVECWALTTTCGMSGLNVPAVPEIKKSRPVAGAAQ